jgi:hypothetical protein
VVGNAVVSGCQPIKSGNTYTIGCGATGPSLTLTVSNYNYDGGSSGASGISLTCTDSTGANPLAYVASNSDKIEVCKNFKLGSVTNSANTTVTSNTAVGSGLTESTSTNFTTTPVAANDVLTLNFSSLPDTYNYTCVYSGSTATSSSTKVVAKACP